MKDARTSSKEAAVPDAAASEGFALGYVRVSTTQQGASGLGLAAQRKAVRSLAESAGFNTIEVVEEIASGKAASNRAALNSSLDRLAAGEASALVVMKLDRLARSLADYVAIADRAQREGWRLIVGDVPLDLTSPVGQAVAGVLAVFAELERKLIAERTREARAAARAEGRPVGGRPEGVTRIPEAVLERIGAERAAGRSYRAIATGLTESGVPTVNGAAKWSGETVRQTVQKFIPITATGAH